MTNRPSDSAYCPFQARLPRSENASSVHGGQSTSAEVVQQAGVGECSTVFGHVMAEECFMSSFFLFILM